MNVEKNRKPFHWRLLPQSLHSWRFFKMEDIFKLLFASLSFSRNMKWSRWFSRLWVHRFVVPLDLTRNLTKKEITGRRQKGKTICVLMCLLNIFLKYAYLATNAYPFSQSVAPQSPHEQTRSVLSRCTFHCPLPSNCLSSVNLLPLRIGLLVCLLYTVSRWCWVLGVRLQSSWVSLTVHGKAQPSLVAWQ